MKLQKLYSKVRQAVKAYHMIEEGDYIALGVSGGKDSLSLLYALAGMRAFYPNSYRLVAISIDLGFDGTDYSQIQMLCKELNVEFELVHTNIGKMSVSEGCSLCSRLRKGALNDKAIELGCNKIAYAHNMDDVIETMMLSLLYEGRFSTFYPVTDLEKTRLRLIRPFVFVTQYEAVGFMNKYKLPVMNNLCPYDKTSKRAYIREELKRMEKTSPGVRKRLFTAICDGTLPAWKSMNEER